MTVNDKLNYCNLTKDKECNCFVNRTHDKSLSYPEHFAFILASQGLADDKFQ